jgi:uncharacterized protein YegP (UPF0339 family)
MRHAKFVIHKSGPYSYFELMTAKEEVILHSELHRWRGATEDGVEAVKANAPDDARYQRRKSETAQHYFVLTSSSGEVLGTSGMHATAAAMEAAILAVKRDGAMAEIEK